MTFFYFQDYGILLCWTSSRINVYGKNKVQRLYLMVKPDPYHFFLSVFDSISISVMADNSVGFSPPRQRPSRLPTQALDRPQPLPHCLTE